MLQLINMSQEYLDLNFIQLTLVLRKVRFFFLSFILVLAYSLHVWKIVPPADASSLSLPSLERRDNYQHRFASRKSHNSDDNSSQLTFEEMQMLSRTPPDNNLNRKFATSNNITARNSSSNNHNHTTSQPISKSSSADKSLLTSTNEPYQDYITIRNEHMKDNTDNVGAAPHIDKKPRKN